MNNNKTHDLPLSDPGRSSHRWHRTHCNQRLNSPRSDSTRIAIEILHATVTRQRAHDIARQHTCKPPHTELHRIKLIALYNMHQTCPNRITPLYWLQHSSTQFHIDQQGIEQKNYSICNDTDEPQESTYVETITCGTRNLDRRRSNKEHTWFSTSYDQIRQRQSTIHDVLVSNKNTEKFTLIPMGKTSTLNNFWSIKNYATKLTRILAYLSSQNHSKIQTSAMTGNKVIV